MRLDSHTIKSGEFPCSHIGPSFPQSPGAGLNSGHELWKTSAIRI
jgi:hypothetical protein